MGAVKPETRCKHLARDMRQLATHIASGFSPSVDRITLEREDWELLRDKAQAARAEGFTVLGDRITYHGIQVVPRAHALHISP